jgi:hypothetical protein
MVDRRRDLCKTIQDQGPSPDVQLKDMKLTNQPKRQQREQEQRNTGKKTSDTIYQSTRNREHRAGNRRGGYEGRGDGWWDL